jgi:hypothetical protein
MEATKVAAPRDLQYWTRMFRGTTYGFSDADVTRSAQWLAEQDAAGTPSCVWHAIHLLNGSPCWCVPCRKAAA